MESDDNFYDKILDSAYGFNKSDNIESRLLENLKTLESKILKLKKRESTAPLLTDLINLTIGYFDAKAKITGNKLDADIAEIYNGYHVSLIKHKSLSSSNNFHIQHMAIGSIVQALIIAGMIKDHAISAVAEWILIPQKSTDEYKRYHKAQIEKFHASFLRKHNPANWCDHFMFSPYFGEIDEFFRNNLKFPAHLYPNAQNAYEIIKEEFNWGYDD